MHISEEDIKAVGAGGHVYKDRMKVREAGEPYVLSRLTIVVVGEAKVK